MDDERLIFKSVSDWRYRYEGNAHILLSYEGTDEPIYCGYLLRLRKESDVQSSNEEWRLRWLFSLELARQVLGQSDSDQVSEYQCFVI
jgi:hypothetical protein